MCARCRVAGGQRKHEERIPHTETADCPASVAQTVRADFFPRQKFSDEFDSLPSRWLAERLGAGSRDRVNGVRRLLELHAHLCRKLPVIAKCRRFFPSPRGRAMRLAG